MYLGYPEPPETGNTVSPVSVGGLSYAYNLKYKFNFWQPKFSENFSSIFIAHSFGNGKNTEVSHSESIYVLSWIYEGKNLVYDVIEVLNKQCLYDWYMMSNYRN